MLRKGPIGLLAALALFLAMTSPASAQNPVTENGDAGSLPSTAQVISEPVDEITGTLATLDQEDLYRLCLAGGQTFSATTDGSDIADTQLFLFDATGHGVFANDDNATSLQSTLPAGISLTPTTGGIYYLGVSSFDADPVSTAGPIFDDFVLIDGVKYQVPSPPGGDEPVSDWTFFGTYTGGYRVQLTGTTSGCLPTSKADCKQGEWQAFGTMFKNQGQCTAFANHQP
jgi:hypothetical protein